MKIEQVSITKIIADEGKVLRRKNNGMIYGNEISLGYSYTDTDVGLPEPHLDTPDDFEEIDKPSEYEGFKIDQVSRLKRISSLVSDERENIDNLGLTSKQSLEVIDWFPEWKDGEPLQAGNKVSYDGKLYEVLQSHISQSGWEPSTTSASLFREVTEDDDKGTIDNPIEYDGNMALESGKYYKQDGVTYLCTRDTGIAVFGALSELVGIYVELAN